MPDPIEQLHELRGVDVSPLPPAEVRRRGDRLRRRNAAFAATVAGVAAVLIVATPLALLTGGDNRSAPMPPATQTPSRTDDPNEARDWPTRIPDSFPLTAGMADAGGDVQREGPSRRIASMTERQELGACDKWAQGGDPVDRLTVRQNDGSSGETREIRLFRDDVAAAAYLTEIRQIYANCPKDDQNGAPPVFVTTVESAHVGDDSLVAKSASDGIGRGVVHAIRVGNAILVETVGDEAAGDEVDLLAASARESLAEVIAAMNRLERVTQPDPDETEPAVAWRTEIPAGFPLMTGIKNDPEGSSGPTVSAEGPGVDATARLCSPEGWPADEVDRLVGEDGALDYSWRRELQVFANDEDAQALMSRIRQQLAACPSETTTDPAIPGQEFTLEHTVRDADQEAADETLTWTDAYADGGLGTQVFQFVRVGNAVAASRVDSESNKDGVADQVPLVTDQSGALVAQMCIFAAVPCDELPGQRSDPVLGDDNLVTADQLPKLPDNMAWQQVEPQPVPTLACQGDWLSTLGAQEMVSQEYRVRAQSAGADLGMVNVAVLWFADKGAADASYDKVLGWLRECPATRTTQGKATVDEPPERWDIVTSPDVASIDRAHRALLTYPPVPCDPGCEALWWDYETVAQVGTRLVLVTDAEYAGPCGPITGQELDCADPTLQEPWHDRVAKTIEVVVGGAIWDLH